MPARGLYTLALGVKITIDDYRKKIREADDPAVKEGWKIVLEHAESDPFP